MPVCSLADLERATQRPAEDDNGIRYRCQATEIVRATTPLSPVEPWQYLRDLASRNVTLVHVARYMPLAVLKTVKVVLRGAVRRVRGGAKEGGVRSATPAASASALALQAGENVQIRPRREIMATLNKERKHQGLSFDSDMAQYCGGTYKVLRRVERIIDEKTGRMLNIKRDCIALDGVICTGLDCRNRLFCTRGVYTYWREAWLKRAG